MVVMAAALMSTTLMAALRVTAALVTWMTDAAVMVASIFVMTFITASTVVTVETMPGPAVVIPPAPPRADADEHTAVEKVRWVIAIRRT
jgi:hypothetical protein